MIPVQRQHRMVATLQSHWKADAMRDARYNHTRYLQELKAGNTILARAYHQEEGLDLDFGRWRGRVSDREIGVAGKLSERERKRR